MSRDSYIYFGVGGEAEKPKEFAMTQMFENSMQNLELQQKQIMMMGGLINKKQKKLSEEEIKQLKKDYSLMYFGFVSINWGQGKTLGVSWQKGLEQMDAYIKSKSKIMGHPVNNELVKIHSEFRKLMAKTIMTNPYVEEKLDERLKEEFLKFGMKDLRKGKGALDATYEKYMPEQTVNKTVDANKFNVANQNARQMFQMLMLQNIQQRQAA